jgi:hypothetical protein
MAVNDTKALVHLTPDPFTATISQSMAIISLTAVNDAKALVHLTPDPFTATISQSMAIFL